MNNMGGGMGGMPGMGDMGGMGGMGGDGGFGGIGLFFPITVLHTLLTTSRFLKTWRWRRNA